jgi:hypothetical protein
MRLFNQQTSINKYASSRTPISKNEINPHYQLQGIFIVLRQSVNDSAHQKDWKYNNLIPFSIVPVPMIDCNSMKGSALLLEFIEKGDIAMTNDKRYHNAKYLASFPVIQNQS